MYSELKDKSTWQNQTPVQRYASHTGKTLEDNRDYSPVQRQPNRTGLPDNLKSGMESLSGMSLDHVKVHYNSPKPAAVQAHAYAQGSDIHLASGQEKHLPHELGHVVQQAQGRVQPTTSVGGMAVNDSQSLEDEATVMGSKALQMKPREDRSRAVAHSVVQKRSNVKQGFGFLDNRFKSIFQRNKQATIEKVNPVSLKADNTSSKLIQRMFKAGGMNFPKPTNYSFTPQSALEAVQDPSHGQYGSLTGHSANSGVKVGDVASYGSVKYLEKVGDGLTGDHQPSGAAIKENIRLQLHASLQNQMLTRSMAKNAYNKAITIVMTDIWHKASSRTYGGRNTKQQIDSDAADLLTASMEDWKITVEGLKDEGLNDQEIQDVWDSLNHARQQFFQTGKPQVNLR